ncbi:hypothetical protein H5410_045015 [Solanum commersonii]|uniref:Uncharacterized protein n=1 Tax=Solanum commersonii TaxID=4109 RepID=A0A9J5XAJ1_SOLCO|nr:hypothetical protein H5410_045015 [Solanum commersonii]
MESPENNYEHLKAKFIDDLPPLLAKRVRKTLSNDHGEIPYKDYTYGKLIRACTQEGINLCNELNLSRQLKTDKLKERSQLGDFCTQFDLPDTFAKSKKKKYRDSRYPNPDKPYRKKRSIYRSKKERDARKAFRKSNRFTKNRSKRDLAKINFLYTSGFESDYDYDYDFDLGFEEEIGSLDFSDSNQHNKGKNIVEENILAKPFKLDPRQGMFFVEENTLAKLFKLDPRQGMFLGLMQIVTAHKCINAKGFSATYEDRDISYTFITDPISHDINALINMKQKHVDYLQLELFSINIFDTLKSTQVQEKIKLISEQIAIDICVDHPDNTELVEFCKREIDNLLQKGLIKPSKSPWSCTAFYVNNVAERERGVPRLDEKDHKSPWTDSHTTLAYLSRKQNDTFASIAKEDNDDIKSYEKGIIVDSSIRHIAKKISVQDEDKEAMINSYLEEVKRVCFSTSLQYEKSDTSMRIETSKDAIDDIQEAQPLEATTEDTLRKAEDILRKLKEKYKL